MASNDLTFWKNYQTAMEWAKGNSIDTLVGTVTHENETGEADSDPLEFLIDDEILDFYRHSHDHRIDRKHQQSQEKNDAEQIELIPGEQMRPNTQAISKLPPVNRSKLRQLELDWLYGSGNASRIQARETHLQMEFDQIFDKKQPSYFPSLPNRLQLAPLLPGQQTRHSKMPIVDMNA